MKKTIKILILLIIILIQSCISERVIFLDNSSNIEHKGKVIKENILEFAINEISRMEYCEDFYEWELKIMPNLKYRIIFPEINISVISESYNAVGYLIKDKNYNINCNCKQVKVLNRNGLKNIYGTKKLPKFIGSILDTLNLNSEFRMEKEKDLYLGIETKGFFPTKEITNILFNANIDRAYVTLKKHTLGMKNLYIYNKRKEEWELKEKDIRIE